jgi:hypothetical protein
MLVQPWRLTYFNNQSPSVGMVAPVPSAPDNDGLAYQIRLVGPLFGTRGGIFEQDFQLPSGTVVRCGAQGMQQRTDGITTTLQMLIDGYPCGSATDLENDVWSAVGGNSDIILIGQTHTVSVTIASEGVEGNDPQTFFLDSIFVRPVNAESPAPPLCPLL